MDFIKQIYVIFIKHKNLLLLYFPLIILSGVLGGLVVAAITFTFLCLLHLTKDKLIYRCYVFLLVFMLSDNLNPYLIFFNELRFVAIVLFLFFVIRYLKRNNLSYSLIPFTIIAFLTTLFQSNTLSSSLPRCFAFLTVALISFNMFAEFWKREPKRNSEITLLFIIFIYLIPLALLLVPGYTLFLANRYKGIMGNPNGLALLSVILLPTVDLLKKNISKTFLIKFTKLIIIVSVILSGSRNGIISIFLYESIKFFLNRHMHIFFVIIAILTGLLLNSIDLSELQLPPMLNDYFRSETLETASGRTDVWILILDKIKEQPLFGYGLQYENDFLAQYVDENDVIGRQWSSVWNSYLTMLLNVGIFGTIFFFYFIWNMYKNSKIKVLATSFLVSVCFSAIFESWLMASLNAFTPLFYFYFAIQSVNRPNEST